MARLSPPRNALHCSIWLPPDRSRRFFPLRWTLANRIRAIFLTRQFPTTRRCQLECNATSSIPSRPFVHELLRHSSRVFRIAPRVITNKSPAAHNQSVANTVVLTGCGKTPGVVSNPPVPPKASSLFGHNATALLPHRSSFRRNIRARSGHRGFFRNLLKSSPVAFADQCHSPRLLAAL